MTTAAVLAGGLLGGTGHYLHWGVISISVANLVVVALIVVLLAAAVLLPYPVRDEHRRKK